MGASLFAALYPCWTHSTGAVLSLSLLSQVVGESPSLAKGFSESSQLLIRPMTMLTT